MRGIVQPTMELNLEAARLSREIEERIKSDLLRLSPEARKSVLERVIVDVLPVLLGATEKSSGEPAPHKATVSTATVPTAQESADTQWEKIEAYCRAHPSPDGTYHNAAVAEVLDPVRIKDNRNLAVSTIYTATKRRSLGVSTDPRFVLLGNAKFRLVTAEERSRASASAPKSDRVKVRLPGSDRPATERVVALLDSQPEQDFRAEMVAQRLGISLRLARDTLCALAKEERIARTATAIYCSTRYVRPTQSTNGTATTTAAANPATSMTGRDGRPM